MQQAVFLIEECRLLLCLMRHVGLQQKKPQDLVLRFFTRF